ncbi:peptidase S9 family protein [Sphingomonas changbaiensis NBRC 104936]|uniref:Peptidase S9 family protein n=1 Tax=Sphingomonas changbaiensis NBRC 104936 TaxID=1219043 RepID=A0A0E9MNZ5_9SPHN|nr:S9 family peptidase [Sphingomonas changbaiensis]GAO39274.1 peptidase S9 family protein [Sphingomonas changbaiensis NBRC 104936]
MKKTLIALALGSAALTPTIAEARPMTATDLATMRRIGAPATSPDGRWLVYQLRETDLAANKGRNHLWLLDLKAKNAAPVRIASGPADKSEHDPAFSADGKWIYFLSDAGGSDQLWRVAASGGAPEQLTSLSTDIGGFLLAPTGDRIAIWGDRPLDCTDYNCTADAKPDASKGGSGRTYDQLFVRHWDTWAEPGTRSRIFVLPMADGKPSGAGVPVATKLVGDAPSKPFGGSEELAWSPDGKTLYFALREAGRIEPLSTNLDIFAAGPNGEPVNLTDANDATDTYPAVSPDGKWLAYAAMKRPRYEADRLGIMLRNVATGATREVAPNWDRSVGSIAWAADGKSLLVTAGEVLDEPLFRIDIATGKATRLTEGGTVGNVKPLADGSVVYTLNSIQAPDDLYRWKGGKSVRLTAVNADKLKEIDPVSVKRFSFAGANGDTVWGQIIKTEGAAGKLPVELLVHGGPQGSFGNSWSYRWNPKLFVAPGYAAVTIDFHGSTGYGQAFTDSINKDWGGKPLQDLKLGLPAAAREDPQLDIDNACALGGSYGGYMMNWIEGNWPDRFKCIVMHDGVFDARAMAYETEELWFDEWEHGGHPYYEAPQEYEKWNPVNFVDKWKTPMLVIHGEKDFRIPYTQGLAAFTALQRRDIPSRLLIFPDENHWVLKPRNSIQWYSEVFAWLDRWLRPSGGSQ